MPPLYLPIFSLRFMTDTVPAFLHRQESERIAHCFPRPRPARAAIAHGRKIAAAGRALALWSLLCLGLPQTWAHAHGVQDGQPLQGLVPARAASSPAEADGPIGPAAQGTVARLLTNPYGEVDGLWLEDGTIVRCSPRLGRRLAEAVQPGDEV